RRRPRRPHRRARRGGGDTPRRQRARRRPLEPPGRRRDRAVISATRLAWLQLRRRKIRLGVALAGVGFAVVLINTQLGFEDALFRSAVTVHQHLLGDVVLIHPHHNIVASPTTISRRRLYQALGFPGVVSVAPVYTGMAKWRKPETGRGRDILVM